TSPGDRTLPVIFTSELMMEGALLASRCGLRSIRSGVDGLVLAVVWFENMLLRLEEFYRIVGLVEKTDFIVQVRPRAATRAAHQGNPLPFRNMLAFFYENGL